MRHFHIMLDYNDADYVSYIVSVEDEVFEKFKPLIDAINNFRPYVGKGIYAEVVYNNWETREDEDSEKTIYELYSQFPKEYINEFKSKFLYHENPEAEYGAVFHTIYKFQEIFLGDNFIDGDYRKIKSRESDKVKEFINRRTEIYSYRRKSDGKYLSSIPFAEMTREEDALIKKAHNLWKDYQN